MARSTTKTTPRDFFLHLLSTVTLYLSVIAILIIAFQTTNHFLPDILRAGYYQDENIRELMRTGLAMLFIAFPVYGWTVWYIRKLTNDNPKLHDVRIRKWLTYLTIFVAALIIIITLITLVWNFLSGELTARVGIKILSVLVVAKMVFAYYLIDARDKPKKRDHTMLYGISIAAITLAAIGFVLGFVVIGSPAEERARRIDQQRVNDLREMSYQIEQYYQAEVMLPDTLSEVYTAQIPTDPATGEPYTYEKTSENSFELCATFETAQQVDDPYMPRTVVAPDVKGLMPIDWSHGTGEYCYRFTIRS